jgi:hypothetical protein
MIAINFHLEGLHYGEISMLTLRGLHVKHAVQSGIWAPTLHSSRSQDLPNSNCLVVSSPALNTRILTLVPF